MSNRYNFLVVICSTNAGFYRPILKERRPSVNFRMRAIPQLDFIGIHVCIRSGICVACKNVCSPFLRFQVTVQPS